KAEKKSRRHRKEEVIVSFQIGWVDFVRQAELQKFVGGINEVSSPIAESAHAEVIPAAPFSIMVQFIVFLGHSRCQPSIPIHRLWDRLFCRPSFHIGI